MNNELIKLIDEVAKYGIQPNLVVNNREVELERNLVKLYSLQLDLPEEFDENVHPEFERPLSNLRTNIESNFPNFGYYKVILDINNFEDWDDIGTGDAIDDLHDIIKDLLEVKWRLQNNGDTDGHWYLKFAFGAHIKEHILNILKYMIEIRRRKITE